MIDYRDATPADGAVLGGIVRATFIETFGHLYALPDLEAFLHERRDAAEAEALASGKAAARLAEVRGVPVGFAKVTPLAMPAPDPAAGALELKQLYVFRPWHGAGIANVLIDWAKANARARGASELWLSVFSENQRARRFYVRHGWEEICSWHFMVGDQADEDILCRCKL